MMSVDVPQKRHHTTNMNSSCHTCEGVMSHLSMSHATHKTESCHSHEGVMSHTGLPQKRQLCRGSQRYESALVCRARACVCALPHQHALGLYAGLECKIFVYTHVCVCLCVCLSIWVRVWVWVCGCVCVHLD